ncbi:MAG TPA: 50S ribosomal protein L1 [Candidatus Saccharimonadales bacterium]|nr:50S ribosomal protein L1 [Candidatus Saccharimonadales bacterium]
MAEAKKATNKKTKKEAELVVETAPVEANEEIAQEQQATVSDAPKVTAKAGKRSSKGLEEAGAKAEKIEHQKHREDEPETAEAKPKRAIKPTRSKLERRSKGFRKAAEQLEKNKTYNLDDAVALAKKTSPVKFDATVELHVRLGVDPRQADQNIRDNLVLPAGTGKAVRIAVFDDQEVEGADVAGVETITKQLDKGELNFDVLIATPAQMAKLGKYARLLGPRGLMPNPKSGTVTTDIAKAVGEAKAGRVEYRVDSTGIIHLGVGKVSFSAEQLSSNIAAVIASLKANKPASIKGVYFKAIHLSTTMGPSVAVDLASTN